ncbi:unnamed protein product [Parajaminaea phylloscopi]
MQSRPFPLSGADSSRHQNGVLSYPGGPTRRVRRVPVSSCDQCRIKKMRCDAKDRPHGETCANCERYGRRCTFRDKESDMASKAQAQSSRPKLNRSASTSLASMWRSDPANTFLGAAPNVPFDVAMSASTTASSSSMTIPSLQPALPFGQEGNSGADEGNHPSWLWASTEETSPPSMNFHAAAADDAGDYFAVPAIVTSVSTGLPRTIAAEALIERLLERFYDSDPSFATLVAPPRHEMLARFRTSHSASLPLYLVHVVAACSAATQPQPEAEIKRWAPSAWREAIEAVQERLSAPCAPDMDLVRALLLLTITSAGKAASPERVTSFETALALAQSLKLNCRHAADACSPNERAQRLQLFWILYVLDKLLAVARQSRPLLPMSDMPFLSNDEMVSLGLPAREADVLQGLALATIHLMQILETVQTTLYSSTSMANLMQLDAALTVIQPLEQQLEQWCKTSRNVLSQGRDPLSRHVASNVISLLHLVQLQVYSFTLRLEASLASVALPITFHNANFKAMIGSIESSLHLVRRGHLLIDGRAAVREAVARDTLTTNPMNFDSYLMERGAAFLKFFATAWAGWANGEGVFNFLASPLQTKPAASSNEYVIPPPGSLSDSPVDSPASQPAQKTELPSTESFTDRRTSTADASGARPKKAAPKPLPLASNSCTATTSDLFPRLNTATMLALDLPMTPAHRLFENLTSVDPTMLASDTSQIDADAAAAAASLFDWSPVGQAHSTNGTTPAPIAPSVQVDHSQTSQSPDARSVGAVQSDLDSLLNFDLQFPLVSPRIPPYLGGDGGCSGSGQSGSCSSSTGLTPFLSQSGHNLAAPIDTLTTTDWASLAPPPFAWPGDTSKIDVLSASPRNPMFEEDEAMRLSSAPASDLFQLPDITAILC